ncbi:MAG: DUF348 domain-containing protein [Coriobacteriia bacterium]|nr:DUF348 domain-containing protein [Coriobacteriia bacterium]
MRSKPTRSAGSVKTQYLIAALIPVVVVTLSITGFVWAKKQVTVVVDGRVSSVSTRASDVEGVLQQVRVSYGDGDLVTPSVSTPVSSPMTVVVRHATPIKMDLGGSVTDMNVVGKTVSDALVAAGIDPSANPAVSPSLTTPLAAGMTITAPSVFSRVTSRRIPIAFARSTRDDSRLPRGVRKVVVKGRSGVRLRLYRTLVSNGVEGSRALLADKTVTAPVDEIVAVGTASRAEGNRAIVASARALASVRTMAPPKPGVGRRMRVEATGYAPGSGGADHRCATGALATRGVIAVDPRMIPLGTHVYVPGYGYAVAADTGGDIKHDRIDVCYDTYDEAIRWGRRTVTIIVLD